MITIQDLYNILDNKIANDELMAHIRNGMTPHLLSCDGVATV